MIDDHAKLHVRRLSNLLLLRLSTAEYPNMMFAGKLDGSVRGYVMLAISLDLIVRSHWQSQWC